MAISEYAPGSGVVAAKKLWISGGLNRLPDRALPQRQYAVCHTCYRFYYQGIPSEVCPNQCGGDLKKGTMIEPRFGFIAAEPDGRPLGEERPPRLYSTKVLFMELAEGTEPTPLLEGPGGVVEGRFSRQGSLAVVNSARDRHFRHCQVCGFASPGGDRLGRKQGHLDPRTNPKNPKTCKGVMEVTDLGHTFVTDIVEFRFPQTVGTVPVNDRAVRFSLLAALLEGARRRLQVSQDDLAGVSYIDRAPVFALYDDVPGGAGLAREAYARAREVFESALQVCNECTCGEHSSCYGCLRSYRNQDFHQDLDRTLAAKVLADLLSQGSAGA
jgi:hypothetical protein